MSESISSVDCLVLFFFGEKEGLVPLLSNVDTNTFDIEGWKPFANKQKRIKNEYGVFDLLYERRDVLPRAAVVGSERHLLEGQNIPVRIVCYGRLGKSRHIDMPTQCMGYSKVEDGRNGYHNDGEKKAVNSNLELSDMSSSDL